MLVYITARVHGTVRRNGRGWQGGSWVVLRVPKMRRFGLKQLALRQTQLSIRCKAYGALSPAVFLHEHALGSAISLIGLKWLSYAPRWKCVPSQNGFSHRRQTTALVSANCIGVSLAVGGRCYQVTDIQCEVIDGPGFLGPDIISPRNWSVQRPQRRAHFRYRV